ncbi:MAG: LamG domain-containing protein [bacterium]|nr:LamG domain-containing protein [bacterium]
MPDCLLKRTSLILSLGLLGFFLACGGPQEAIEKNLRQHVLFFSNFEKGVYAFDGEGEARASFDTARTNHVTSGGNPDGYVQFKSGSGALSYPAKDNFPYASNASWSGSVAFWLNVDLSKFESDYPEPFHIGKRTGGDYPWDDAVVFLDFKKSDNAIRFGCYPNKAEEISDQMVIDRVISIPLKWKSGEWHHVAMTWNNFNSGKSDATWSLYLDGQLKGQKGPVAQSVTWDMNDQVIRFNHYKFPGEIDEIAVFSTALTADEVKYLTSPKQPLNKLFYKKGERR